MDALKWFVLTRSSRDVATPHLPQKPSHHSSRIFPCTTQKPTSPLQLQQLQSKESLKERSRDNEPSEFHHALRLVKISSHAPLNFSIYITLVLCLRNKGPEMDPLTPGGPPSPPGRVMFDAAGQNWFAPTSGRDHCKGNWF